MQYQLLLPAGYSPSTSYPVILYLHQLDNASQIPGQIDPWFNSAAFRTNYPAIVVAPQLDQSADPSGQTINWGGVSAADTPGELNALAILKQVMSQYSSDSTRVYVTGNSMGGIGTWDLMIKYNAYDGTEGKIFAAGMPLAGTEYAAGYPNPNQSVIDELRNVPIWAIHGAGDTQVQPTWDRAMAQALSGSSTFHYTEDPNLAHDVWDTYYQLPTGKPYFDWLFSQHTGSTPPPPPPPPPNFVESPNNTVVLAGSTAEITDANGNKWTITGGQVAINGAVDTSTGRVIELAYVNGHVWQENADKLWWDKATPSAPWGPPAGTSASPLPGIPPPPPQVIKPSPNYTVVLTGTTAAITDTAGNKWTVTAGGQVAVNGVIDTTTGRVIKIAYTGGNVWQQNADKLWWSKAKPTDSWGPPAGTATSPLPSAITIPATEATTTIILSSIKVNATAGDHMVFIKGYNNIVSLTGGKETITDTGVHNTYVLPAAGKGTDTFTSNILVGTHVLDFRPALAATKWDHSAGSIGSFLHVTPNATGAVISVSSIAGGPATTIATINGATTADLKAVMAHALT